MVYDFEPGESRDPPKVSTPKPHPKDLEIIVTLLDLAAIYLTPKPDTLFSEDELLAQMQAIGGGEITLDPRDVRIVLPFMKSLKRHPGRRYSLR